MHSRRKKSDAMLVPPKESHEHWFGSRLSEADLD